MMFFDYSVLCADVMSIPVTPTDVDNITSIEIKNAWYDDLYVTKDVESDYVNDMEIPTEWDFDTILHAEFDGNLIASNTDFTLESVSGVLIKYKKADDFNWIPLLYRPINTIEDFNIKFSNKSCAFTYEYEHAIVPVLNGIEDVYAISKTRCESDRLVIVDEDELWSTPITDGFCDTTRVAPSTPVETLFGKYPHIIRNTNANYDTITISGTWMPYEDESGCMMVDLNNTTNVGLMSAMNNKVKDFLTNGKAKLFKNIDGRIYLGYVTTPPSDTADGIYNYRKISFGITEIGDANNVEDLYEHGLIDSSASEEWW